MRLHHPVLALLTDFGLDDPYVGIVKGVILSINPRARIVDLSHGIAPQDISGGAFVLASSFQYFPEGTVFMAVVDPGVGTDRRVLVLRRDSRFFVAPDNGILSWLIRDAEPHSCWEVVDRTVFRTPVSNTFHARDIFAPVAARLSLGHHPGSFGRPVADPVLNLRTEVQVYDWGVCGRVIYVDRFGNLVTNIHESHLSSEQAVVEIMGHRVPMTKTYADVSPGSLAALVGSSDYLEISVNMGNASRVLGAGVSTPVKVCKKPGKSCGGPAKEDA